jgi:hypothetical protein
MSKDLVHDESVVRSQSVPDADLLIGRSGPYREVGTPYASVPQFDRIPVFVNLILFASAP